MLQIAWHIPCVLKDKSDIEVSNKILFFNHLTHSRHHSIKWHEHQTRLHFTQVAY